MTVVLDHDSGRAVRLNAAAGCVWDALEQPAPAAGVAEHLGARFKLAPERARADAEAALQGLEARGLVTRAESPPAR